MERKKATDFPQELLNLFDRYVHGEITRRGFLDAARVLDLRLPRAERLRPRPGLTRLASHFLNELWLSAEGSPSNRLATLMSSSSACGPAGMPLRFGPVEFTVQLEM